MSFYRSKNDKWKWQQEPFVLLLTRIVAIVVLFSFSRWMLYMLNTSFFPSLHLFDSLNFYGYGLRFDLVVIAYINIPVILYYSLPKPIITKRFPQLLIDGYYVIANGAAIVLNLFDTIYFRFNGQRISSNQINFFEDTRINLESIGLLGHILWVYWYMVLFGILAILLVVVVAKITRLDKGEYVFDGKWKLKQYCTLFIMLPLTVLACRGGIHSHPDALQYTAQQPQYIPIVLNTPFTIVNGNNTPPPTEKQATTDSQFQPFSSANPPSRYLSLTDSTFFDNIMCDSLLRDTLPDNVVLIILESFGQEMIGYYNTDIQGDTLTPFLDSLLSQSLTFDGRANGRRSVESLCCILSGLPALIEIDFPFSEYKDNKLEGFLCNLKAHGYNTSFYYGSKTGTMRFDKISANAGANSFYSRDHYNNDDDYDQQWGIYDQPFMQYFANNLDSIDQPFATVFHSLSAHHPFKVPKDFPLPKRSYHWSSFEKTIYYTDCALHDFFETAKTKEWFDRTLFVITANHVNTEHSTSGFNNFWDMYAIPIAFYYPKKISPERTNTLAQQLDLGISILSFLKVNDSILNFGGNLFDTLYQPAWLSFVNHTYQYSDGNFLIQYDGDNLISVFNLKKDLKDNLKNSIQCPDLQQKLQEQLDSYNKGMEYNQLTYGKTEDTIHHQPDFGEIPQKEPRPAN